jgi:hypothetical protein
MMGSFLTKECHIDTLGDDLVLHILEFLKEDLKDLKCLGLTNKYFARLIYEDSRTNILFGKDHRQYWKNLYNLNELLVNYTFPYRNVACKNSKILNRLGILSKEEERYSIPFDHPRLFARGVASCSGYFGFMTLPTEVAVWGDYSGVTCLPNLDSFLHPTNSEEAIGTLFDESFQVMAVCSHDNFLFLGCASGEVHCISNIATASSDGEYPYLSRSHDHEEEVTAMAVVGNKHLATASMTNQNQVILHWDAMKDGNLGRISKVHVDVESIFSLASTTVFGTTLLQIGSTDSTIVSRCCIWTDEGQEVEYLEYNDVGTRDGNIIFLKYLGHDESRQDLIVGKSSGEVLIYGHEDCGDFPEDVTELESLKHCMPYFFAARDGCLEAAELVGDVLILAGGPYGCIHFLNWKTYRLFGHRTVHPGVKVSMKSRDRLHSTVIGMHFSHERGSLISVCRDGHVHEMSLLEELERERFNEQRRAQNEEKRRLRKRTRSQEPQKTIVRPTRPRRNCAHR